MIRVMACLALAAGTLFAWPQQTEAAESYDSCTGFIDSLPATISRQGTWCLRKNLSTDIDSGDAIEIDANNVTIDCNGFRIGGRAGTGTRAVGIYARYEFNTTVRNCTIRGFRSGIDIGRGGGHLVESNYIDGNTSYGIHIDQAPGSTIRNNIVANTGRGDNLATGIYARGDVDIINNTVAGVAASGNDEVDAIVRGIFVYDESRIIGNRIHGLSPDGRGPFNPLAIGIDINGKHVVAFKNIVQGPDPESAVEGYGIYCWSSSSSVHANVVAGFEYGIVDACFSTGNFMNRN